ncbi:sigma-70 family RNA polymerase sigma factor [Verrucomicrobiaceae bacterium R5-34]|uniref:Sigma-70 family RNA polymerase sigma factor n=1 Tax=Oceaniferula flava TaxID=2800421 RepID=A0AAE2V983_9BACT|nr:sigma-70 family RNA polymerase sigma factor [Oceaniferula flavus]MBK1830572.1 sigma-70 family RNA polymerase sigma factor [Verrucomicrobiaceae bacterium R5-34]MBK1854668.1 sigma-70 family RNA polymerase sigma factor [Oceaniferula flavus]MBM1135974.1 sigma-70 family RNA polymerase sigma factor [Oceaniferula flavus]
MVFPITNWATISKATLNGGDEERTAMGAFIDRYWKPVSVVIQSKGVPFGRVEDLTQDFFVKLIEDDFVSRATQEKGRFRSFLLKALRDFLVDDMRKFMAQKRGGSFERVELRDDSAVLRDDQLLFDKTWAKTLFDAAIEKTAKEIIEKKGEEKWQATRYFLSGEGKELSYVELGQILGVSENAAKTHVSRLRSRLRENLREQISLTVGAPHEVDEELAFLREVMMH